MVFGARRAPGGADLCIIGASPMRGGSSVFRVGPFELDSARGRLFRGPAPVPLSSPQAAILLKLVAHVGEVVLKDQLVTAAWDDSAVTDNSLDKAISRLRQTLGSPRDRTHYIETVPNRGYRFVAAIERAQRHDLDSTFPSGARRSESRPVRRSESAPPEGGSSYAVPSVGPPSRSSFRIRPVSVSRPKAGEQLGW